MLERSLTFGSLRYLTSCGRRFACHQRGSGAFHDGDAAHLERKEAHGCIPVVPRQSANASFPRGSVYPTSITGTISQPNLHTIWQVDLSSTNWEEMLLSVAFSYMLVQTTMIIHLFLRLIRRRGAE